MNSQLFLVFKYGESSTLKLVDSDMTFGSICSFLCLRWNDLSVGLIGLSYFLEDLGNCILFDDDDLQSMIEFAKATNTRKVNVVVKKLDSGQGASSSVSSEGRSLSIVESIASSVDDGSNLDIVSISDPVNTSSLLSSGWSNLIKGVGQIFPGGASEFRSCLMKYSHQKRFEYVYIKNETTKIVAACKKKDTPFKCQWRIRASLLKSTFDFMITRFNEDHSCDVGILSCKRTRLSCTVLGELIEDEIVSNPTYRPKSLLHYSKKNFGLDISYTFAWRAVEKGKNVVIGDHDTSYGRLHAYFSEMCRHNPGSVFFLEYNPETMRFKRCFFVFGTILQGFNSCKPVIYLDATFTKGLHKSNILNAVGKDGNTGLYPFAFGIVHEETDDNWDWFLKHLKICLAPQMRDYVFVTDRNHGILEGVKNVFPDSCHTYCLLHLRKNLEVRLKGMSTEDKIAFGFKFRNLALINNRDTFHVRLDEMRGDGRFKAFVDEIPFNRWANAYFEGFTRWGEHYSNGVESWHNQILGLRFLPITTLVDKLRQLLMIQLNNRRILCKKWTKVLCPVYDKLLNDLVDVGRSWEILNASDDVFEVLAEKTRVVNIAKRTCSCRAWQLNSFPCSHATTVLMNRTVNPYNYIERCYHLDKYSEAYSLPIYPFELPSIPQDAESIIHPPLYHRTRGRPKTKRIRSAAEKQKRDFKCGRCKGLGHNRKTCTSNLPICPA